MNVIVHNLLKLLGDGFAFERYSALTINIYRCRGNLARARQADTNISMLALTRAIDHATHHSNLHVFYSRILAAPYGHLLAQIRLDLLGQLLEKCTARAPASGARHHHWGYGAQAHGFSEFLRALHLFGPCTPWFRGQGNTYGIANALWKQYRQGRRRTHHPFPAPACLGQPQTQRILPA